MTYADFTKAIFRLPGVVYVGPAHNPSVGVDAEHNLAAVRRAVHPKVPVYVCGPVVLPGEPVLPPPVTEEPKP